MTTLQDVIAREEARKRYRDEYNKIPRVQRRRKLYTALRLEESRIARRALNQEISAEEAEEEILAARAEYEQNLRALEEEVREQGEALTPRATTEEEEGEEYTEEEEEEEEVEEEEESEPEPQPQNRPAATPRQTGRPRG